MPLSRFPARFWAMRCLGISSKRYLASNRWLSADVNQRCVAREVESADLPTENDLLAMIRRLERPRPTLTLPLLAIESMLPGQRVILGKAFHKRAEVFAGLGDIGVFGMYNKPPASPEERVDRCHLHTHGVSARVQHNADWQQWEIVAQQAIRCVGPGGSSPNGVKLVRVEVVEDEVSDADVEAAKALRPLVAEWFEEVQRVNVDRFDGRLTEALGNLGTMPSPESAGELAFWVAALVNPLPAFRLKVLAASSVSARIDIARAGIEGSIGHITGRRPPVFLTGQFGL